MILNIDSHQYSGIDLSVVANLQFHVCVRLYFPFASPCCESCILKNLVHDKHKHIYTGPTFFPELVNPYFVIYADSESERPTNEFNNTHLAYSQIGGYRRS